MQKNIYKLIFGLSFLLSLSQYNTVSAQADCISAPQSVCAGDCANVTYIGGASPSLTYIWSSLCATIENPNQMDPGQICFTEPGICNIFLTIQTVGAPPQTCSIDVLVLPLPGAGIAGDATICEGECTNLKIDLTGSAPFTFAIITPNGTDTYTTSNSPFFVEVCPEFTSTYSLEFVSDLNCTSTAFASSVTVNVLPYTPGSVVVTENTICAFPAGATYTWFECGGGNVISTDSCYTATQTGCYCVVIGDNACADTVCTDIVVCNLTCGITGLDSACTGEVVTFNYTGNAGPGATFNWVYDVDSLHDVHATGAVLDVIYTLPGCYPITMTVLENGCVQTCVDTICIINPSTIDLCCPKEVCDSCTTITVTLDGPGPWGIVITDGLNIDTVSNITEATYTYNICSDVDTTLHVSILSATSGNSLCQPLITGNNVPVTFWLPFDGVVTQNGNQLCASPGDANGYQWFACGDTVLLSDAACFQPAALGCYCVVINKGLCQDTVCTEFTGCELTCGISGGGTYCIGEQIQLTSNSNAGSGAVINWVIDVDNNPGLHFTNDTVDLEYTIPGCYGVILNIQENNCTVTCIDTICIVVPTEVEMCCSFTGCDTCAPIVFNFGGTAPFSMVLSDGTNSDTITGITSTTYTHIVCPPADSTVTYTILSAWDSDGICPSTVISPPVQITLHGKPTAQIVQNGDTLCALPTNMAGYGWYSCPSGAYLSITDCFVPGATGCYCVDVSTAFDCVDTACYDYLLGIHPDYPSQGYWYFGQDMIKYATPIHSKIESFQLFDFVGQRISTENKDLDYSAEYRLNQPLVQGIYLIVWKEQGRKYVQKIFLHE